MYISSQELPIMHGWGDDKYPRSFQPAAKRMRTAGEAQSLDESETSRERKSPQMMPEFRAEGLDDFYKPCPNYRLPVELGVFSFDDEGKFCHDRSQLRYYNPPSQTSRLSMDLKVGYDEFIPKAKSGAPNLEPILRWICVNGHCFRPRSEPLSPNNGITTAETSATAPAGVSPASSSNERPDNLLTNFIVWRGMLTKMLCSLYNHQEPWKVTATLYKGTIYLQEIEMEEKRQQEARMSPQQRATCYWGLKFEDYVTSKDPPPKALPQSPTLPPAAPGTVNPHRAYSSVVRTRMNSHSIVMVGEVDCCDHNSKEKPPQNYIELKTSRIILTDRNKASFRRHKLMKWWAQSFLVGVPKLVCGFRNDDGIIKSLQTFKISDIPRETQVDLSMWQPSVCLNFLDELLVWIRKSVTEDNPKVVYLLEWNAPYSSVTCQECPPHSEHVFLPDWYINKQHPPST